MEVFGAIIGLIGLLSLIGCLFYCVYLEDKHRKRKFEFEKERFKIQVQIEKELENLHSDLQYLMEKNDNEN